MKSIIHSLIFIMCCTFSVDAQVDWELAKQEKGISVWTKDYPDSNFKQFKTESTIDASLENVVEVFLDIENMGAWYDRVEKVNLVKKISETEGVYIIDFALPWPVADRVSAVRATMSGDVASKKVIVKTQYAENIIAGTDKVLVTDIHSEWVLTALPDNKVHIFHKGFMDPGGSLPSWIANSGVKDGPVKTITALVNILPDYQ